MRNLLDAKVENCLRNVIAASRRDQGVATFTMDDGLSIFVYPETQEFVIAIGFSGEHSEKLRPDLVLRRRTSDPGRFAQWLPCTTSNGARFLLRRMQWFELDRGDQESLRIEVGNALELMS